MHNVEVYIISWDLWHSTSNLAGIRRTLVKVGLGRVALKLVLLQLLLQLLQELLLPLELDLQLLLLVYHVQGG